MRFISKILCITLLVLSLNLFAKLRVCSQSPELLVKNFNIAYEKRDGSAFYDLISEKSAMVIERKLKAFLNFAIISLKQQLKKNPGDKKKQLVYTLLKQLLQSSKKAFYENLFQLLVISVGNKMPAKIDLKLQDQKIEGNHASISILNKKGYKQKLLLLKENGCWKLRISEKILRSLSAR